MDVGFIVDSSGSLTTEYHKQKKFVKQLAESFQISQSGTRAGVILFSYHAEHRIKLLDHDSTSTFNKAVDDLPLMRSTTRIDKALLLVQKGLFTKKNGGREGVPKLLILLTDGSQTPGDDAKDPAKLAEAIRKSGVKFVVVAMGAAVNKTELTEISGDPSNLHIADTFDQLISPDFIRNISEASCKPGMYSSYAIYFQLIFQNLL